MIEAAFYWNGLARHQPSLQPASLFSLQPALIEFLLSPSFQVLFSSVKSHNRQFNVETPFCKSIFSVFSEINDARWFTSTELSKTVVLK